MGKQWIWWGVKFKILIYLECTQHKTWQQIRCGKWGKKNNWKWLLGFLLKSLGRYFTLFSKKEGGWQKNTCCCIWAICHLCLLLIPGLFLWAVGSIKLQAIWSHTGSQISIILLIFYHRNTKNLLYNRKHIAVLKKDGIKCFLTSFGDKN